MSADVSDGHKCSLKNIKHAEALERGKSRQILRARIFACSQNLQRSKLS